MDEQNKQQEKRRQAAALKYDATKDRAPYVVGLGQGHVAETMLKIAAEQDIPVVEDKSLSQALQQLGLGEDVPEDLYQVIAEVLVFVARLDGGRGGKFGLDEVLKGL